MGFRVLFVFLPVGRHGDNLPDCQPVALEVYHFPHKAGTFLPAEAAVQGEQQRDPVLTAAPRGTIRGRDQLRHVVVRQDFLRAFRDFREPDVCERV